MKTQAFLLLALGHAVMAGVLEPRVACPQANNCARAVYGSGKGTSFAAQATKDCSSFNLVTVTPPPYTSTITAFAITTTTADVTSVTTLVEYTQPPPPPPPSPAPPPAAICRAHPYYPGCSTTAPAPPKVKRTTMTAAAPSTAAVTVTPTGIPTYASACPNSAAYSSACSCLGVARPSITTVATPTVLTTLTTTQTTTTSIGTTVTSTACPSPTATARFDAADDNDSCTFNAFNAYGAPLTPDTCVPGASPGRGVAVSVELQGAAGPGQQCVVSMYSSTDCSAGLLGAYDLALYAGQCVSVAGENLGSLRLHCQCV